MGVYDGSAAGRTEQTGPALNFVSSPGHFLPPGTQCLLITPLITELACPLPLNSNLCVCLYARAHTHTHIHVYLFDSFN